MNYEKFAVIDNTGRKNGRCLVKFYAQYFIKRKKYDDFFAHVFKTLSNALLFSRQNNYDTFDVMVDLKNLNSSNLDFNVSKDFMIMVQQLFPDKLNQCYFYNAPNFFRIFFQNLSYFIDRKTQKKYFFVNDDKTEKFVKSDDKQDDKQEHDKQEHVKSKGVRLSRFIFSKQKPTVEKNLKS